MYQLTTSKYFFLKYMALYFACTLRRVCRDVLKFSIYMHINIYNITCTGTLVSATSQAAVNNHRNKVKNSHWLATIAYFQMFDSNGHQWSTIDKHCEQVHEHVTRRTVLWRDMKPWQRSLQYKGSKSVPHWSKESIHADKPEICDLYVLPVYQICFITLKLPKDTKYAKFCNTHARTQARTHASTHASTHARMYAHTETDRQTGRQTDRQTYRHPPTYPHKQLISSTIPSKMRKMPASLGYRYNNCTRSPNSLNLET